MPSTASRRPSTQPRRAADCLQRPLRFRFRQQLTPSVRHEFHRSGKEVRQQQWSWAKWRCISYTLSTNHARRITAHYVLLPSALEEPVLWILKPLHVPALTRSTLT